MVPQAHVVEGCYSTGPRLSIDRIPRRSTPMVEGHDRSLCDFKTKCYFRRCANGPTLGAAATSLTRLFRSGKALCALEGE
jgi:hypothetical protein